MPAVPTTIPGSASHVLGSTATGREYEISVWRPAGAVGPLPVLLVTDGNLMFPLATSTVALMVAGSEMPPVQVVGVGYPVGGDLAAIMEQRPLDLFPVRGSPSVGADGFFGFVHDELSPWLAQRYDVTDDRTLFGASLGGLFALHVLLNRHGFFRRYIAVSPAVASDPGFYDEEARRASAGGELHAIVSLTAGACEDQLSPSMDPATRAGLAALECAHHARRIGERLASRAYGGLRLTTTIMPDQTHFTMPFAGMAFGLRNVFA